MKANELSIGWAMQQKDPAAAVQRVFDNVRRYSLQAKGRASEWLSQISETMTALCATDEGEVFTRMDVLKANAACILVLILIGIGGAL